MTMEDTAQALARLEAALQRRPQLGLHDDAPATARWSGGLKFISSHANGAQVASDMPAELGGEGTQVTPGWLFRAGLASCAATVIAMHAAAQGVDLTELVVQARSRSDTRGVLGLHDADGKPVSAGPQQVCLHVRIAANAVAAQRLQQLVESACRCSPVPTAVQQGAPIILDIEVGSA